ncbi:uncharacterized protein LOC142644772 isoform X1 [Castanea sativa]|uniref:uncharacterized protein LOC142644772 isoform X1 n=1 Tax=Castanea sativa TaxID=21020 RepID=UPI003F64F9EF
MDPMEENIGWGSLDDLDGEYEICICARNNVDGVSCYTIKVPDREARAPLSYFLTRPAAPLNLLIHGVQIREYSNFTPKDLSPFSVTSGEEEEEGPYASRDMALLNNHLYSVGGYAKLTRSEFEELRGGEYYPQHRIYMPTRSVWTLDLTCPDLGWKQLDQPMRNRRKDPKTIVVDGKLYVFGGLYGYKPIPEDSSSGRGWMEVYDPITEKWDSLPNPPFSSSGVSVGGSFEPIMFAHLELEEDKHQIMVLDLSNSEENNMCADFFKYNVMSSTWETWLQQHWTLLYPYAQCGRAVVVDHTKAYWACIVSMEKRNIQCCIFGFDLKSESWARERLNPTPFLGESEYFFWTSPGLLHLSDHKFCLLLSSRNSSASSICYFRSEVLTGYRNRFFGLHDYQSWNSTTKEEETQDIRGRKCNDRRSLRQGLAQSTKKVRLINYLNLWECNYMAPNERIELLGLFKIIWISSDVRLH